MQIDKRNRADLKQYFVRNSMPSESNFAELIDALLSQRDDGITRPPNDALSIEAAGDATSQKKALNLYASFADPDPAWVVSLNPRVNPADPATAKPGLSIGDATGVSRLFVARGSGRIGVGTLAPEAALHIDRGATNELALMLSSSGPGWGSGLRLRNTGDIPKTFSIYAGSGALHFRDVDADVERMVITQDGNVGIGAKLYAGALHAKALTISAPGDGANAGVYSLHNESNKKYWAVSIRANEADKMIFVRHDTVGFLTALRLGMDGLVEAPGSVGIGTAAPRGRLDVPKGDVWLGQSLNISAPSDEVNAAILNLTNESTKKRWHVTVRANEADKLIFWRDDSVGFVPVLKLGMDGLVEAPGKVGIGTATPQKKLHVQGATSGPFVNDAADRPGIAVTGHYPEIALFSNINDANFGPTIRLGSYTDGTATKHKNWVIGTSGRNSSFLDIGFSDRSTPSQHAGIRNTDGGKTVLTLREDGFVGVGTTTPRGHLDVAGGHVYLGRGAIVTGPSDGENAGFLRLVNETTQKHWTLGVRTNEQDKLIFWRNDTVGSSPVFKLGMDGAVEAPYGAALGEVCIGGQRHGTVQYPYETIQLNPAHNLRICFGTTQRFMFQGNGAFVATGSISGGETKTGWTLGSGGLSDNWLRITHSGGYHDLAVNSFFAAGAQRYDLAEVTMVRGDDRLEQGDVVVIDHEDGTRVRKSVRPHDAGVYGVVSSYEQAAMVIGGGAPEKMVQAKDRLPIALVGRVKIKVSGENGPIRVGDLLTSSSTPGHAMRCPDAANHPGAIAGKALEAFAEGTGTILALVTLQ